MVCALQNGVEQKAQLEPLVSGATVLPSVVWFPAQREPDASVWLRAKPRLTLPDLSLIHISERAGKADR
ncbi:hypothetical protein EKINANG_43160 [Enterobacter sp. KINAN-G]|nr:hypothetical protein EKINANG_43160 [Enterobacter sp. KINAN-G]